MELDVALKQHAEFERAINDFESHKVCYLPLNAFVLKPAQRILYYKQILESELGCSYVQVIHVDGKC